MVSRFGSRKMAFAAVALVAMAIPLGPARAAEDGSAAVCYTEATFRLAEGLTDEPSNTTFHSEGEGTVTCFGTVQGQTLNGETGSFSASGRSSSTSCTTGSGSFHGNVKIETAEGVVSFGMKVDFQRVGLTGTASGEIIEDRTPLDGVFAAQPLDGNCSSDPVDHVTIRVATEIGAPHIDPQA